MIYSTARYSYLSSIEGGHILTHVSGLKDGGEIYYRGVFNMQSEKRLFDMLFKLILSNPEVDLKSI